MRSDDGGGGAPPGRLCGDRSAAALLERAFRAGVRAANPRTLVEERLPEPPAGSLHLLAVGKGAVPMAEAALKRYGAKVRGLIVAPSGAEGEFPEGLSLIKAGHPVPNEVSEEAGRLALSMARSAASGDLLLVLLSGGGSALLSAPAHVTLAEKADLTRRLLASGATIGEINTVRKHLSCVKGGRLAAATPARTVTLALSDVVDEDPVSLAATIASGPTVPDPTTYAAALEIVERHAPEMKSAVRALRAGAAGEHPESPKPGDPRLARATFELIGDARASLGALREELRGSGVTVRNLGESITGEAREVGAQHGRLLAELALGWERGSPPVALISGGELTVTLGVERPGRGGPNGEYALAAALELHARRSLTAGGEGGRAGAPRFALLAGDSDGVDGAAGAAAQASSAAGALLGAPQLAELSVAAMESALERHDSHSLLEAVGGLLVTGETGTNVNDLRALLIY